jgi:hypothetical protein
MKPANVLFAVLLIAGTLLFFSGCTEQAAGNSQAGQQPAGDAQGNTLGPGGARGGRPGGGDFNGRPPNDANRDFNMGWPGGMDENRFFDMAKQQLGLQAEASILEIKQALGLPETASIEELRQSFFEKFGGDFNSNFGRDFNRDRRVYNE